MAGISEVSETTGIKTRRTCSVRVHERGKRKRESQKQKEKERARKRKERERNKKRELLSESIVTYMMFIRIGELLRDCRN